MTTTCPTCNKAVDPLRSRFVGVVAGKVVAYCSAECAGSASHARPAAAAPVVAPTANGGSTGARVGGATGSTGVPARAATPSAGVPVVVSPSATRSSSGPPRPITPAPGVLIDIDSGPVIEIVREPASGGMASAGDAAPEPRATPPGDRPAAREATDPDESGAVRTASAPRSAPVELPGTGRDDTVGRSTRGAVTARRRTDHALSDGGPGADATPPRKRRASLVLLILFLLAAGGFLAYQYFVKHDLAAATKVLPSPAVSAAQASIVAPRPPATEVTPAASAAPAVPAIDVAAALEEARAILRADLTVTSQRLSRIAAAALARTQDRAACDALAAQIGLAGRREPPPGAGSAAAGGAGEPQPSRQPETSDIAKLDLAYALARGSDPRGRDALSAALGSQRADLRDEAARLLALLGDPRAVPHLIDVLGVSQRRLGAAEHLAHLAEPHAIQVLEQIRGDAKTSADDRTRATIALGIAGHPDVAPALRDMLGDPHFNAFAAAALAELKDGAARPVLESQLESPMLRVRAARALRRLDPALDPKPVLPRLLDVLTSGRDVDQVQAAEAILLLAGPVSWSAYD